MRRLLVAALCVPILFPSSAVAAENGTVMGRVESAVTGKSQAGVGVQLTASSSSGKEMHRTVETTDDGRYRFNDLPTGDEWLYAIDATFDGGLFPGRPFTIPSGTSKPPVISTRMRVWPTTTDPNAILLRRDDMFVLNGERGLGVIESLTVLNQSQSAYIGRGAGDSNEAPTLGIAIPPAAESIRIENATYQDAVIDIPRLLGTDFGAGLTIAIPPGETQITFSYVVPGTAGRYTLSRTNLYPTVEMSIFSEPTFDVVTNRLSRQGTVSIKSQNYDRYSAPDGLEAGDELQIVVTANATMQWWMFTLAGAGVVVLVGLLFLLGRRRSRRRPTVEDVTVEPDDRDELVAAIATLDLDREAGRLQSGEWEARRRELKSRLEALAREQ